MGSLHTGLTDKQRRCRSEQIADQDTTHLSGNRLCQLVRYTTVTWNTIAQPVAQSITKLPNVADVCVGGTVSATFSGGSGGVSPTDVYEYSTDGGGSWAAYTPGSPISSAVAGANRLQIRTQRTSLVPDV